MQTIVVVGVVTPYHPMNLGNSCRMCRIVTLRVLIANHGHEQFMTNLDRGCCIVRRSSGYSYRCINCS